MKFLMPVSSFIKEVNPRLDKSPLVFNGRLANRWLTPLVKKGGGIAYICVSGLEHHRSK